MTDLLRKMEAIVRKDCERFVSDHLRVELVSCVSLNGDTRAYFTASAPLKLWSYHVVYFWDSNVFHVIRYKFSDTFDIEDAND